jgi:hypothetical protein
MSMTDSVRCCKGAGVWATTPLLNMQQPPIIRITAKRRIGLERKKLRQIAETEEIDV